MSNMDFKNKKYALYFHHDFDGVASAATIFYFLKKHKGVIFSFHCIYHYSVDILKKWPSFRFDNKPAIVLDILYHPDAVMWFDHHDTTFIKKKWRKKFKNDIFHQWKPKSLSCCNFLINHLERKFGFKFPKYIKELGEWADIIDGVKYASVKELFNKKIPAHQITSSLQENYSLKYRVFLIKELSQKSIKDVAGLALVKKIIKNYKNKFEKSMRFFKKNILIQGNVAFLDAIGQKLTDSHFAPFYLHSKVYYAVRITNKKSFFYLHASSNPWRRRNKINIGGFLRKHFGGGGHYNVAGASFKDKENAFKAAKNTIDFFNING